MGSHGEVREVALGSMTILCPPLSNSDSSPCLTSIHLYKLKCLDHTKSTHTRKEVSALHPAPCLEATGPACWVSFQKYYMHFLPLSPLHNSLMFCKLHFPLDISWRDTLFSKRADNFTSLLWRAADPCLCGGSACGCVVTYLVPVRHQAVLSYHKQF